MRRAERRAVLAHAGLTPMGIALLMACAGARPAPPTDASPVPQPAATPPPAPVMATPAPAEVSVQVRETRAACGKDAAKQGLEVIDFVTFNRLDENNWDATIRARRRGRVVRVGCRYDLRAGWTYVYEPAAADGGNPWGTAAPGAAMPGAASPATASSGPTTRTPTATATSSASTSAPPATTAAPAAPPANTRPVPGSNINLAAIPDSAARGALVRTRDGCLAEATRRKITFADFDAFRRVDARTWEAQLILRKGQSKTRPCRFDLETGKATIR